MTLLAGRYRLEHSIARGGMAEVWEGVDEVLTRSVAVKLLHPHLAADEAFRERFRREAIAAARLAHPSVVATFDTGEDGGRAYIVMELVRGRTLRAVLDEAGVLSPQLAAAIGIQVADALQHAHENGIVHRDVKPANILVCDADAEGGRESPVRVKVADFGIARAASASGVSDLTQPGALLGTAKYLAPEQVEGEEPTPRSDVYALGVVLYEL
ncbi:MAG: eukaryotic-like serine/threonine-protein kinase, partial [Actinomycetota bacterium]|nr:eukaryotic-like serine/threonine-protein kinase [Actinomycetota bacterium]